MENNMTRFRCYKLSDNGLSMSYITESLSILIEARYNDENREKIQKEIRLSGHDTLDILHISKWNERTCNPDELKLLLQELSPISIEIPGVQPEDQNSLVCLKMIRDYCTDNPVSDIFKVTPNTIHHPNSLADIDYIDVFLSPINKTTSKNDYSIVKLFKQGMFSVLYMGDSKNEEDIINTIVEVGFLEKINMIVFSELITKDTDVLKHPIIGKVKPQIIANVSNTFGCFIKKDSQSEQSEYSVHFSPTEGFLVKYGNQKNEDSVNKNDIIDFSNGKQQYIQIK